MKRQSDHVPDEATPGAPKVEASGANTAIAPSPPLSAQETEELRARAAKADESWDRLLRTTADFENYKKRAIRERQDAVRYANEGLIAKLLPVLDSFDMAFSASNDTQTDGTKSLRDGVEMVGQQLRKVLEEAGLEEIDAPGKPFDPNFHEAIAQQESATVPEGHVLLQTRRGYKLQGRLLRPASVVVARKSEPAAGNAETGA